ncbi:ethanolamine ammonia-lyase reactivating factor EutA [Puniceibacterium sp. IMCC21224]|uniref:ethanolamine ammonia-lyase reactivating factor EutA n=1 Tax=Puniceibacterium sp. IMCC21224 TaxID=1618204 RepID=UPI00064DDD3B|nr:ethanolamine ammonia-lyase reactivating factor EutA [Puniceibacterium sp. IMCC21224]KMK65038.1 ethanolamine utilization protein, possible chaperonin protecting lyase from inhibition [Puniceibacterium sp. IMCC21224]
MNAMSEIAETGQDGGRIFFSEAGRSLIEEDEIALISVGVDIGSSTSHLLFSSITLERMDTRYIVAAREVLFESEILLTPYAAENTIDAGALGRFIAAQYVASGLTPEKIDTGALILTGTAARRANARAIGELFAGEAGKFVAVSAGDALETLMAAQGSGAAALSMQGPVVNVDIGGGTTKLAVCEDGEVGAVTALDVGARLLAFDSAGRIVRLEPHGARHLADAGIAKGLGEVLSAQERTVLAAGMATRICEALCGQDPMGYLRLAPIVPPDTARLVFSGGVSEYIASPGQLSDDLGPELALAVIEQLRSATIVAARQRIRATVVGASQYTVQVSGATIFLDPGDALPLRNLPVIAPKLSLGDEIDADAVAVEVGIAIERMGLAHGESPCAIAIPWQGSATYDRLAALAKGLVAGLRPLIDTGHPLVVVCDGDIGGLLGMQARSEENVPGPIVSIDGIQLSEFDFVDIGAVIRATGAAPVVVKSLLFPTG